MADEKFEVLKELANIPVGSRGDSFSIRLMKARGGARLDIRRYFTTDEGIKCPTKKGISLSWDTAQQLRTLFDGTLFEEWEKLDPPRARKSDDDV